MACFFVPFLVAIAMIAIFVGKTKGITKQGRQLYLMTIVGEMPCILTRTLVGALLAPALLMPVWLILIVFIIVSFAITHSFALPILTLPIFIGLCGLFAFVCGFGPAVLSILILAGLRSGYRFARWTMGARVMSDRENRDYLTDLARAAGGRKDIKVFSHVFVMRWVDPRATVIGTTLYIAKPLLHGHRHLTAVLAHNLGYINSADGRLIAALRALVVPPMYILSWATGSTAPGNMAMRMATGDSMAGTVGALIIYAMLALSGGGWGEFLFNPFWAKYWQDAQFRHDKFGASLGQRETLIAYLEDWAAFDIATPYFFPPYADTELRIDALMKLRNAQPASPASQPQGVTP